MIWAIWSPFPCWQFFDNYLDFSLMKSSLISSSMNIYFLSYTYCLPTYILVGGLRKPTWHLHGAFVQQSPRITINQKTDYQGVSKEWPIDFQKNLTKIKHGPFFWGILDKIMCSEPNGKTWFTKLIYVNYWVRAILSRNFSPNNLAKIASGPFFRGKNWWAILLRHPGTLLFSVRPPGTSCSISGPKCVHPVIYSCASSDL